MTRSTPRPRRSGRSARRPPSAAGRVGAALIGPLRSSEPEADARLGQQLAGGAALAAVGAVEREDAGLDRVPLDEARALTDDREVDPAALDRDPEAAADHAEAAARAAVADAAVGEEDVGRVGAGDDGEVRVAWGLVEDGDRAAVEPADHAAAGIEVDLAAAVLDRERAFAGRHGRDRRDGQQEREQRQA